MKAEPASSDMRSAMVQVAEEATYIFLDEPSAEVKWPDDVLMGHIQVYNPYCGELILVALPDWCGRVALSFEGRDKLDEEAIGKHDDALGEMLNIVCGVLVGENGDASAQPSFGLPHVHAATRQMLDNLISIAARYVLLETDSGDPIALLFVAKDVAGS